MRRLFCTCVFLIAAALPAYAQRNQLALEASIFSGALSYARQIDPKLYWGVQIGAGIPQLDRTLVPGERADGTPDFEEYLHAALFLRAAPSDHFEVDVGIRGSIADLWPCGSSDCWPMPFIGAYAQPMVGWRRLKFGPRLTAGWVFEAEPGLRTQDDRTWAVGLSPITARYMLPW